MTELSFYHRLVSNIFSTKIEWPGSETLPDHLKSINKNTVKITMEVGDEHAARSSGRTAFEGNGS